MKDVLNWFSLTALLYENYHKSADTLGRKNLEKIARRINFPLDQFGWVPNFILAGALKHTKTLHAINRLMKGVEKCIEDYPEKGEDYYSWKVVYAILTREEIYMLCEVFRLEDHNHVNKAAAELTQHTMKMYRYYEKVQAKQRISTQGHQGCKSR